MVEVIHNGPLMVYGNIEVKFKDGTTEKRHNVTAFCRCGSSNNKPFCDGTHRKTGFEG
jgi:CDGSH-type Zn-finger protein